MKRPNGWWLNSDAFAQAGLDPGQPPTTWQDVEALSKKLIGAGAAKCGIEHLVPRSGTQFPEWNIIMAAAGLALLPPVLVILALQRWFVQGLVDTEK